MKKKRQLNTSRKHILVIGDTVLDHNIYLGNRLRTDSVDQTGSRIIDDDFGGAKLVFDFTQGILKGIHDSVKSRIQKKKKTDPPAKPQVDVAMLGIVINEDDSNTILDANAFFGLRLNPKEVPSALKGYALWDLFPKTNDKKEKEKVWRISKALGYGGGKEVLKFPYKKFEPKNFTTLLLDDAALGFRFKTAEKSWPVFLQGVNGIKRPESLENIIYKMASPICRGDLWRRITQKENDHINDILTTILSIDDLRKEEIKISKGRSWEQTTLELINELMYNHNLSPLRKSKNLIITMASEGALLIRDFHKPGEEKFELVYDPAHLEGEWEKKNVQGSVFGLMSAFTASVSAMVTMKSLMDEKKALLTGIKMGLQMMRNLKVRGHVGKIDEEGNESLGFSIDTLVPELKSYSFFQSIAISPHLEGSDTDDWMILTCDPDPGHHCNIPLFGLARQVAIHGTGVLKKYPHRQYNDLLAIERKEIESLANISGLIRDYKQNDKGEKPLSLALFGPPGSGKSFTVKELAKEVLGEKAPLLTFNLSQFKDADELIGSFHQVRDQVLKGNMPMVFWDEFDSQEYRWLQYLLAPMQDGEFQEGQITHPIGKCVFVFAGATSHTFEQFGPDEKDHDFRDFRLKKGPDFKSRLSGYLNILGPNKRQKFDGEKWTDDVSDVCFPLRRAILMRSFWKYFKDEYLEIDSGLLTAFLEIDQYIHGVRSMEKLVLTMRYQNKERLLQSNLPSEKIISLYVNHKKFMEKIHRDAQLELYTDKIAPCIHEYYRELGIKEGWITEKMNRAYKDLDPETQESNIAAAKRITRLLAFVSLKVIKETAGKSPSKAKTKQKETKDCLDDNQIRQILEQNLELLAEEEHNGWMRYMYSEGWQQANKRDDLMKRHPSLVLYCALSEKDKGKDRNSIRCFPDIIRKAGLKIIRIQ